MLKTKSFDILDYEGINEILTKFPLAQGGQLIVSEGKVLIPYEDGEPDTNEMQATVLKAVRNKKAEENAMIAHSQKVNALQVADAEAKIEEIEAELEGATANAVRKEVETRLNDAKGHLEAMLAQVRSNDHEMKVNNQNIEMANEEIAALSK